MRKHLFFCFTIISIVWSGSLYAQVEIDKPIQLTGSDGERSITNLELPVNGSDAVNKDYVDNLPGGGFTHFVGEQYGGGIVVSVWKESGIEKGLIVALAEISAGTAWSNVTSTAIGAPAQSLYNGASNTAAIIGQAGHSSSAAKLCDDYAGAGFTDWYLPSVYEMGLIYDDIYLVNRMILLAGGTPVNFLASYWSSSESNASNSSTVNVIYGPSTFGKGTSIGVRAVRSF